MEDRLFVTIERIFEKNNTKMILSGGVGNGFFATRIFNRPEILIIELK